MSSNKSALKSLRKLKTFINVLPTDERVIEQSSNSDFSDFEDAIQYFTSVNNGINLIITRNTKDFKKGKISISTAEEFIKTWEIEHSNEDNENEE
jgi:hypothetical protein